MLHEIVAFCNHPILNSQRKASFLSETESELYSWIEASNSTILEKVIPESFWDHPLMSKSTKIERLGQSSMTLTDCIIMLIFWSSWSQECCQSIVKCLEYGAKELKSHQLDWLCTFAGCISLTLNYGVHTLPSVSNSTFPGKLFLEAICLRQAVMQTSRMFQFFASIEFVRKTVSQFRLELGPCKSFPKVFKEPSDGYHITKEGKDSFSLVSIVDWFKRNHIIPHLKSIMALKAIKNLVISITTEMKIENVTIQKFSEWLEFRSHVVLRSLNVTIEEGYSARLVGFVMTAQELVDPKMTTSMSREKEMLLLRFFTKCLGGYSEGTKDAKSEIVRIVTSRHLISMEFIAELINHKFNLDDEHWCLFLKFNDSMTNEIVDIQNKENDSTSLLPQRQKPYLSNIRKAAIVQINAKDNRHKEGTFAKQAPSPKQVSFSSEVLQHKKSPGTQKYTNLKRRKHSASSLTSHKKIMSERHSRAAL